MIFSKTKLIIFSILTSLFICVPIGFCDEIMDKQIEQSIIEQEILQEQQQLDILSNQYTEAIIKKEELENEINQIKQQIEENQIKLEHNQNNLNKQAIHSYKNGTVSLLDVVLDAKSFEELVNSWDIYNEILYSYEDLIKENIKLEKQLSEEKSQLEEKTKELEQQLKDIETTQALANEHIKNLEAQYAQLDEEIAELIMQSWSINVDKETIQYAISAARAASPNGDYGDIVSRAYAMLGSPYAWGGTTSAGFDCSGFVSYCLSGEEGVRLGTTADFVNWTQTDNPQPGDICVVHNGSSQHTGIYVGDGRMIHAATYGVGVVESDVQDGMVFVTYN